MKEPRGNLAPDRCFACIGERAAVVRNDCVTALERLTRVERKQAARCERQCVRALRKIPLAQPIGYGGLQRSQARRSLRKLGARILSLDPFAQLEQTLLLLHRATRGRGAERPDRKS